MRGILVLVFLLPLAGCSVKNAVEVKSDLVSTATVTVRHGYQEAITIVRNAVSVEEGVNLACI